MERPGASRMRCRAATAALSGLSACAGVVLTPKREMRLRQLSFVPLVGDRALAVLVGDGRRGRESGGRPGTGDQRDGAGRSRQLRQRAAVGPDAGRGRGAAAQEIGERREAIDVAAAELVASGFAAWSKDASAAPGADRPRPGQSDRPGGGRRSRARPQTARRAGGPAGNRAAAGGRARRRRVPHFHRQRKIACSLCRARA